MKQPYGLVLIAVLLFTVLPVKAQRTRDIANRVSELRGEQRKKALETKAAKEGTVVIYTYRTLPEMTPILEAFMKRYPGIKATMWRGIAIDVIQRVLTEARAGKTLGDVYMGGIAEFSAAKEKNRFVRYDPPVRAEYPQEFKDQAGYWTALDYIPNIIAYNARMLRKQDAPGGYEDLLREKYKGKVGLTTEPVNMVLGLLVAWGEAKTGEFLNKIVRVQGAHLRRSHTNAANLLCAGEYEIHVELYAHRIADLQSQGCPVEMVLPKPTPSQVGPVALLQDAPHPYTAMLFYDWVLGREAIEKLAERGRLPARADVPPKFASLKDLPARADLLPIGEEAGRLMPRAIQIMKKTGISP